MNGLEPGKSGTRLEVLWKTNSLKHASHPANIGSDIDVVSTKSKKILIINIIN